MRGLKAIEPVLAFSEAIERQELPAESIAWALNNADIWPTERYALDSEVEIELLGTGQWLARSRLNGESLFVQRHPQLTHNAGGTFTSRTYRERFQRDK